MFLNLRPSDQGADLLQMLVVGSSVPLPTYMFSKT